MGVWELWGGDIWNQASGVLRIDYVAPGRFRPVAVSDDFRLGSSSCVLDAGLTFEEIHGGSGSYTTALPWTDGGDCSTLRSSMATLQATGSDFELCSTDPYDGDYAVCFNGERASPADEGEGSSPELEDPLAPVIFDRKPQPRTRIVQSVSLPEAKSFLKALDPHMGESAKARALAAAKVPEIEISAQIRNANRFAVVHIDGERNWGCGITHGFFRAYKYMLGGTHRVRLSATGPGGSTTSRWQFRVVTEIPELRLSIKALVERVKAWAKDEAKEPVLKRLARKLNMTRKALTRAAKWGSRIYQLGELVLSNPKRACS